MSTPARPPVPPDGPYELFTGWPGYRIGDMFRSATQRGADGGAAYHCATWPDSLACRYLSATSHTNDLAVMTRLVAESDPAIQPPPNAAACAGCWARRSVARRSRGRGGEGAAARHDGLGRGATLILRSREHHRRPRRSPAGQRPPAAPGP